MNEITPNTTETNIHKEADMALDTTTTTPAATLTAKEFFLDRLESYFDFQEKSPEIAAKVLPDLLRECRAVLADSESVEQDHHRIMIFKIVGDEFLAKEWGREGYPLNGAAALLINRFQSLAEILSQSDLFARFLNAKLRVNALQSTLIKDPELPAATAEEWFLDYHDTEAGCFEHDFVNQMLDGLRLCENPEAELETAVGDLENLLDGIKFLHREFRAVCEQTRTEAPIDEAAFGEWENNPRYFLPVIEQNAA